MTCLEARRIAKSLGFAIILHRERGEPVDVRYADDADVRARLTDERAARSGTSPDWREVTAGTAG